MSDPSVIDLSHWNTVNDFDAVAASGVVGVIHKCTESTSYVDDTYAGRKTAALKAGLLWGAYHFLQDNTPAGDQMQHFLESADLPPGSRIAIDYEDSDLLLPMLHDCLDWLSIHAPLYQIAVYGSSLLKEHVGTGKDPELAETSLWIAHYTNAAQPTWPKQIWPVWSLWQYSAKGSVPGCSGQIDVNRFNGSDEQLAAWFGPASIKPPAPSPSETLVVLSVQAPPGVNVGIIVNGKVIS